MLLVAFVHSLSDQRLLCEVLGPSLWWQFPFEIHWKQKLPYILMFELRYQLSDPYFHFRMLSKSCVEFSVNDAANRKTVCMLQTEVEQLPVIPGVWFQSHSLFGLAVIMLFFTLCSVLKVHILRTNYMYTGEAKEQRVLREQSWRLLGSTEVPDGSPREGWLMTMKWEDCTKHKFWACFPPVIYYMPQTLFLFLSSHFRQGEILQLFLKPSLVMPFGGDKVEKHPLELSALHPRPS